MEVQTLLERMGLIALVFSAISCSSSNKDKTAEVSISFRGENVLQAQVDVHTMDTDNAFITYWKTGEEAKPLVTKESKRGNQHTFLLTNLQPGQQYIFNVTTNGGTSPQTSGNYSLRTIPNSGGASDTFQVACADTAALPEIFKQGYVMVHRREAPGIVVVLNAKGNVVWHHQAKDAGFKVVHFTKEGTLLCLMGTREYETSYGSAVLELSLAGDTLLYLKKGQNDFQQTIHHEIITNHNKELVTLCVEDRIMDLRSRGGSEKDTVRGDGILVLDRQGRKKWKWTVFDELDPLADEKIVQNKKDWMHANSVSFDKDGHYLISFYNNGQIWKIHAQTGKVIWKLGKGGDFEMPAHLVFGQAHAVHINEKGWLQFFDNGTDNHLSRSLMLAVNEGAKKAQLVNNTWLPPTLFSERMGSSYLVGNQALLLCVSRQKTTVLTDFSGGILWQLRSTGIVSYRAQFIPKEKLAPYITL